MTSLANNLNGIASGTAVSTSNSGGVSGNAFNVVLPGSGVTVTAQAAAAYEGATGLQIVYPGTNVAGYVAWNIAAAAGVRFSSSFYFRFGSLPAVTTDFAISTPTSARLNLSTGGAVQIVDASGAVKAATAAVATGTWVYVQWASTVGTTSSNGRVECNVFLASNGSTLLSYDSGTTVNANTSAVSSVQFGRTNNLTSANTFSYDLLAVDNTLASGFPGTPPPVITGRLKVWTGTAWVQKPVKVWTGSAWVTKPVKRWTGSAWVTLP